MDKFIEQRVCIKFCVRNDISGVNCLEMLKRCYGDDTMARSKFYKWHKTFQEGREEVEDEHRPGRPLTSKTQENIEKIKELMLENRRLSIRDLLLRYHLGPYNQFWNTIWVIRVSVSSRLVPKSLKKTSIGSVKRDAWDGWWRFKKKIRWRLWSQYRKMSTIGILWTGRIVVHCIGSTLKAIE